MKKQDLKIESTDFRIEDDRFFISIKVKNPLDRTLHSYASVRNIKWDKATKTLKLALSDRHMSKDENIIRELKVPKFAALEPKESTSVTVSLPLKLSLMTGKLTANKTPEVDRIDLRDCANVEVEVDYSETPFYYNPKEPDLRKQLTDWGKTRIKTKAKVKLKADDRPPEEQAD